VRGRTGAGPAPAAWWRLVFETPAGDLLAVRVC